MTLNPHKITKILHVFTPNLFNTKLQTFHVCVLPIYLTTQYAVCVNVIVNICRYTYKYTCVCVCVSMGGEGCITNFVHNLAHILTYIQKCVSPDSVHRM